jgi:4-amino-4-deoxy-L-arabinose transferase-like glycosyltransferase
MPPMPRTFAGRVGLIAAAGLALRVAYVLILARDVRGSGDYFFYHLTANLIADGHGLAEPFRFIDSGGQAEPAASHPPLWPLLLSLASLAGATTEVSHKLVGCLVGTGVIVAIAILARRIAGERLALIAAALAAVYPVLISADGSLMSESLYGLLIVAALIAAHALAERPGPVQAGALGALVGLAALTRSEALLLLPLLAAPIALNGRDKLLARIGRLAIACLATLVVLAPWTVRNTLAFDRFVLISTNDGSMLAGANCRTTYYGNELGAWSFDCLSTSSASDDDAERSARWRREGLEYAREHANRLPVVIPVRMLRTWDLYKPRDQVRYAEGRHRGVVRVGVAWYLLLIPLAVFGFLRLRRRVNPVLLLVLPVLVTVTSAFGYGVPRLRHAAEIALVLLAAAGVERLLELRRRSRRPGAVAAGALR